MQIKNHISHLCQSFSNLNNKRGYESDFSARFKNFSRLSNQKTNIYLIPIPKQFEAYLGLVDCLDDNQTLKFNTLSKSRKKTYLIGRYLLLRILEAQNSNFSEHWRIVDRAGKPPRILPSPQSDHIQFSISHSGDWLALTIKLTNHSCDALLGLDIEKVKFSRNTKTAVEFCNNTQLRYLKKIGNKRKQQHAFTRLWTQKEAYFKSIQKPIFNDGLKRLSINNRNSSSSLGLINSASLENYEISIFNSLETEIESAVFSLDENGAFFAKEAPNINWEKSYVHLINGRHASS